MSDIHFEVESKKPFAESLIWQLNRDFYDQEGTGAWSKGLVPHHLTSSSMVGKTYAELILGLLKDLANKGAIQEKVYLLELGAGHGRLAFHILKHLGRLIEQSQLELPEYCYVLSDFSEDNLTFFQNHSQFQAYYESGLLDFAFFDVIESKEIHLRHADIKISPKDLNQPLLVIANYFFDSIPNDLFHFNNTKVSSCGVSLQTAEDPKEMDTMGLIKKIQLDFHLEPIKLPFYENKVLNEILEHYRHSIFNSYLFFPKKGLECIDNLRQLSQKGVMLLSMDKGYHEMHDLENAAEPDMITHGSMSFWVNYHAFGAYCEKMGGKAFFPQYSTYHLELGCLLFLPDADSYIETNTAYQRFVDDFGPDDFTGMKKFTYKHIANMSLSEMIGILRLSAYDSTLFIKVLPRIKQVYRQITFNDRNRLAQTMHQTWNMYFTINESKDLAFEIAGMLYGLGYYKEALTYFQHSVNIYGETPDMFYNKALCHYQLREDSLFLETVKDANLAFPGYDKFKYLDKLDLGAA